MRTLWLLAVLLGCTGSDDLDPTDTDPDTDTDSDTDSDTDTDTDTDSDTDSDTDTDTDTDSMSDDERLARDAIAGEADRDLALATVAWRGGWPVATRDGTFLVVTPDVGTELAVAGDFSEWAPTAMTEADGLRWAELTVPDAGGSRYKLVDDETGWRADPWARTYDYDENGAISFVRPPDAWHLQRWPQLGAEGLAPRDVRVLVPPGEGPWPVLYAHDGQNLFDPGAIWGGWKLRSTAPEAGEVLVVGIDNTPDRMSEYAHVDDESGDTTFTSSGAAYRLLVRDHVRPHIEATYGSTGIDGLLGSSMGGVAALSLARQDPTEWDFVASMSGTLGWGRFGLRNPTLREQWLADPTHDLVVYVDSGSGDGGDGCSDPDGDGEVEDDPGDFDNYCTTRAFADAMASHGYAWGTTLHHWHEPGAPHNEAAWAARVHRPLEIFTNLAR